MEALAAKEGALRRQADLLDAAKAELEKEGRGSR
jgi:hypothetical protein